MIDLAQMLQPATLLLMIAGVVFGLLWGAMPALSTTMAIALLVGVSANFPLALALPFLIAVLTGSVSGGEMSAVLINIPGTPDALPLSIEGYPLARRGEGGQVLGLVYAVSFLGGWVGIAFLILLAPVVMSVALKFTSWEMFLLALWGVVIAGNLTSGEQPLKGWIAGWLGILIAMVGREVIFGADRFSFGSKDLLDGVDFVPLLIGLFGLAEVIRVLSTRESVAALARVTRILPSWGMLRRYWRVALRGSLIGAVIGCIPGGGANVATYVSYDVAKRTAPPEEREKFGKGSYELIVAAETADNANIGGALLPMLALGIPATAVSAMFMAALNLQGIRVGPLINQDHPGLLYIIYGLLIVANIIMYVSALLLIKPVVRIFSLPRELLMPIISVVCVVGAFEVGLSMFDVGIMYMIGIVGFVLLRLGFPLAPMVLGAILGPMIDENFRRALMLVEGRNVFELLGRPLGLAIIVVILFTLWDGVMRSRRGGLIPLPAAPEDK